MALSCRGLGGRTGLGGREVGEEAGESRAGLGLCAALRVSWGALGL